MAEERDYTQEVILKLRGEEFSTWRQLILMGGGLIGFPATLLGTGDLPLANTSLLLNSWGLFILIINFY